MRDLVVTISTVSERCKQQEPNESRKTAAALSRSAGRGFFRRRFETLKVRDAWWFSGGLHGCRALQLPEKKPDESHMVTDSSDARANRTKGDMLVVRRYS
jgi:hypothetical protein